MFRYLSLAAMLTLAAGSARADGGETAETAVVIPGMPYDDWGNTCGHVNDYDEVCPFAGSTAPDVVYSYTPPEDVAVSCSLCDSSYDTKLYVYADAVGNLVACNDDGCFELQSYLELMLNAGVTYYFVVDGYGTACGEYRIDIRPLLPPCVVECPPGSLQEGEPPCHAGYVDEYNSGCNGVGWIQIDAQQDGCADMCGRICGWMGPAFPASDRDWYRCTAAGGLVTVTVRAEFYPRLQVIYVPDCWPLQYVSDTATPCETAIVQRGFAAGEEIWIAVRPYENYANLPESDYHLRVCGIEGNPTPVERITWSRVKSKYR